MRRTEFVASGPAWAPVPHKSHRGPTPQAFLAEDVQVSTPLLGACVERLRAHEPAAPRRPAPATEVASLASPAEDADRVAAAVRGLPVSVEVATSSACGVTPPFPDVAPSVACEQGRRP
jgi:hypothetical protein